MGICNIPYVRYCYFCSVLMDVVLCCLFYVVLLSIRVPGHEIGGVIVAVGSNVTEFKVGQTAGVGCMVDRYV